MNWHDIYSLSESVRKIRAFLISIASMRQHISSFGFYNTTKIEGHAEALKLMDEFPEKFAIIRRKSLIIDHDIFAQINTLENESKFIEQLSLVNLKIQMALKNTNKPTIFFSIFQSIKYGFGSPAVDIFGGEKISLEKLIINCDKLISILKILEEITSYKEAFDDALFKPSNINNAHVAAQIEKAINEISKSTHLTAEAKSKIVDYLSNAKNELAESSPKWNNIIGALVIVAAITSGIADAPEACKTINSIIEYIIGTSKTTHNMIFPPPTNSIQTEFLASSPTSHPHNDTT